MSSQKAVQYYKDNYNGFLEKLKGLVRIESISALPAHKNSMAACAEAVAAELREAGLTGVELITANGSHPYVYGEWLGAKGAPTVLLYSHYDVQPKGDEKQWETKAFEPTEKGERLFGRGTADDKAGVLANMAAIASYLKSDGKLPLNVKFLAEGEEEIGSENLIHLINEYKEKLQADFLIISDTDNYDIGIPAVTTQLRGIVSVDVTVSALKQPVHSGMWGGPVPDAVQALAKIVAKLSTDEGKIAIPGIYDDVRVIAKEEREALRALPFNEELFRKHSCVLDGVPLVGEADFTPHERVWFRPSISVNAIQASSREQVSNIIVDSAWAHIGIRLVPDMEPAKSLAQLAKFIRDNTPSGFVVDVKEHTAVPWWKTNTKHKAFAAAKEALKEGYGREPVFIGSGGSIGFVDPFTKALGGVPAILLGMEDPLTNAHSWNESLYLPDWQKATISIIHLFEKLGKIK